MLNRYKEIFYGIFLGLGAWVIDAVMHAKEEGGGFWGELAHLHGGTLFYRLSFVGFGLALGWSLWKKNSREREFRQLAEVLEKFHREIADPAFLIYAKCEVLLGRDDFHLSAEASEVVRFIYGKAQIIVSMTKERLSILGEIA